MDKHDSLTFDGAISRPLLVAIIALPAGSVALPWLPPILRALGLI